MREGDGLHIAPILKEALVETDERSPILRLAVAKDPWRLLDRPITARVGSIAEKEYAIDQICRASRCVAGTANTRTGTWSNMNVSPSMKASATFTSVRATGMNRVNGP